jgi:alpha-tubulin suppressor-like RCC1 family protein
VSIAAGSYHDCFALDDGSVYCLGANPYGQLGNGSVGGNITDVVSQVPLCQ